MSLIHINGSTTVINTAQIVLIRDFGDHISLSLASGNDLRIDDPNIIANLRQSLITARTDDEITPEVPLTFYQKLLKMFTR